MHMMIPVCECVSLCVCIDVNEDTCACMRDRVCVQMCVCIDMDEETCTCVCRCVCVV